MSKVKAEIGELFQNTLLSNEEIYWIGAPLHNYWYLKGRYLFYLVAFLMLVPLIFLASICWC